MNQKYSTEAGDVPQTNFGTETAEKIRAESDFTKLTDYEKFILHNGYKYKTVFVNIKVVLDKVS